jgi:hypothetical protein
MAPCVGLVVNEEDVKLDAHALIRLMLASEERALRRHGRRGLRYPWVPRQTPNDHHALEQTEDCRASGYVLGMDGQTLWAMDDHGSLDGDGFPDENGKLIVPLDHG